MSQIDPVFTESQFKRLRPGDFIESGGVFPGVCDEPLKWRLDYTNSKKTMAEFRVYYFGVFFGEFKVTLNKKKAPTVIAL